MNAKKNNKALQIILYVAILLIIALIIGFFAFFTNGFTEDYKSFYTVIDGESVLSSKSGIYLEKGAPMEVQVRYALASVGDKKSGYSVRIEPKQGYSFDFTVDGEPMSFTSEDDYSAGFDIVKADNSFTIEPKGNLKQILEAMYPGKTVAYDLKDLPESGDIFNLVVTSYSGKDDVNIGFWVLRAPIEIHLEPEEIVF